METPNPAELKEVLAVDTNSNGEFWESFFHGEWEPETLRAIQRGVRPNTTVLDIGAWIGPTTLYAASFAGVVHSFEPDPIAFSELHRNLQLNPGIQNVFLHPTAITAESGIVEFGTLTTPGDSMSSRYFATPEHSWRTSSTTLQEFVENYGIRPPIFLKIDIEGGEYDLLASLRDLVPTLRPTLLMSLHPGILSMQYPGSSIRSKMRRRFHLTRTHLRLAKVLRLFDVVTTPEGKRLDPLVGALRVLAGCRFAPDHAILAHF